MAIDRPGDPDYEPNPILRASRGSSVSTDPYPSTIFKTTQEGTYKAPGVGGDAPTDQPKPASNTVTEVKVSRDAQGNPTGYSQYVYNRQGQLLSIIEKNAGRGQPSQSYSASGGVPEDVANRYNAFQKQEEIEEDVMRARRAPPPVQRSEPQPQIIGRWEAQAQAQGMPTFDKRKFYSVGYGRTEIYHEYDPKTEFKALGFIPQGKPEPGYAYRQDILGFTKKVGKMEKPSDSMGRISPSEAKLSQASEMLAFSPFVAKVPLGKATKVAKKTLLPTDIKVSSEYVQKPTTWNKNLEPIKPKPSRFGEAQYRAIKLKTPGVEMGERTYVQYNWNQAVKLPVITEIAPAPRPSKMSFTIGAAKRATTPTPTKIIDLPAPTRTGGAGNIEMRTGTGQVLIQKQRTIQKQKVEVIQAPKMATQQVARQRQFVMPVLRQDLKVRQIVSQMPKLRALTLPKQTAKQIPFQLPKQTLRQNVIQAPKQSPKMAPFQLPKQVPVQMPKQAPMQLPKQRSRQTARQVSKLATSMPKLQLPKFKMPNLGKLKFGKSSSSFLRESKAWIKRNRLLSIGDL